MAPALVVFVKECRESLRDRRVLLNALVFGPLLTPLLFFILLRTVVSHEREQAEHPLSIAVVGGQYAPGLIKELQEHGIRPTETQVDLAEAVRAKQMDIGLRIPDDFPQRFASGQPAEIELFFDGSRQEVGARVGRLEGVIQQLSGQTLALRLLARGLAPTLATPLVIAHRDQATPQSRGATLLGMLPYFLVLTALIGGMWLAMDTTAGERERQSMEPLLMNPVSPASLLLGKWLATGSFSLASVLLGIAAFSAVGHALPGDDLGMTAGIGLSFGVLTMALLLPLIALLSILQIWLASYARSFREAQTYLSLAQIVPIIPSLLIMLAPDATRVWMRAVPMLGQQMGILSLLRGEAFPVLPTLAGECTTLVLALAIFVLCRHLYRSERVGIYA